MWLLNWFKSLFGSKSLPQEEYIDPDMKYLIVGLGNIGDEYDGTRHNIGFDIVDHMASAKSARFQPKSMGALTSIKHRGRTLFLLKPSTYMNRSGKAISYWMQKEKIKADKLLVIVDDLNLEFGKLRLRDKGSDGGHNGLKDINQTIGQKYTRLRIGIGNAYHKGQQVNFVLGKWSQEEKTDLPKLIEKSADIAKSYAAIGTSHTKNQYRC